MVIDLGNKKIGEKYPPLIVAEMSGNHNHSLERALRIVNAAADAGVDALKIQTYTADTMTIDLREREFFIDDPKSLWRGESLYELYEKAHTPWEWHKPIFERCRERGLLFFSTPFDLTAVDFLESLNVPLYKVASFENVDLPLIRKIAQTRKPMIISTGMATLSEIGEAVQAARSVGEVGLILLKCTSVYPADPSSSHLSTISHLRGAFQCLVGLSDHTEGIGVAVSSVAYGAVVIEKHFTLSRKEGGVDSAFSLEPDEMKQLVQETKRAWQAMGSVSYGPTEAEIPSLRFRRSLYIVKDTKRGERLTKENLRPIRPGFGLPPKHYEDLLGKKINRDVSRGTPMAWGLLE
ncbi:MAG: pseudaminic acid synthase [Deltaproteobacteria bacterium]